MKRSLLVTVVAGLCLLPALAFAHHGPETVKLPAMMGEVTFQHYAHQDRVEDCTTCHHMGVEAGACRSCHGVKPDAPKAKDAFHTLCRDCHKKSGGPTKCGDCHKK